MIVMAAIYIAGIVSGIIIVAIALAAWVNRAAHTLKKAQHVQAPPYHTAGIHASHIPVALNTAHSPGSGPGAAPAPA